MIKNNPLVYLIFLLLLATSACAKDVSSPAPNQLDNATPTSTSLPMPLPTANANDQPSVALIDALGLDFAEQRTIDVYARVAPSVVNITTQVLRRNFFFQVYPEEGSGSGFIIDKEGHIVTNYHVIENAQTIEVSFGDITQAATIVGTDPFNDIAILQVTDIDPHLLIPVEFGSSDTLQVGQRAIAIGNPFGQFDRTLTTGVVSALDRTLDVANNRQISGLIQTDTAINRGNSGGPLLDSAGRVIGINTAIFSPSGTNAGVGFAIPISTLQRILPDLLTLGYYPHPWLGIRYAYQITPNLADILDLPVTQGILLIQLYQESPLLEVNLQGAQEEVIIGNQRLFVGGDILLAIDEQPLTTLNELDNYLETNYQVGETVSLTYLRDDTEITTTVNLIERPYE